MANRDKMVSTQYVEDPNDFAEAVHGMLAKLVKKASTENVREALGGFDVVGK